MAIREEGNDMTADLRQSYAALKPVSIGEDPQEQISERKPKNANGREQPLSPRVIKESRVVKSRVAAVAR